MNKNLISRLFHISGAVQGVGFRPFVYRLAQELGLRGWVRNDPGGVVIQATAPLETLRLFEQRLASEAPPAAHITSMTAQSVLLARPPEDFGILASTQEGVRATRILPDMAVCPDCVRELFDPINRRHRYPFINCTNCGPRFSIIERLPYDRAHTTMKAFTQCPQCQAEYDDPADRRFHAQPNACPVCGPRIEWCKADGRPTLRGPEALAEAASALRAGRIVAMKGLGGFHLLAAAHLQNSVLELRRRKQREEKPLALMYPSLSTLLRDVEAGTSEIAWLTSPAAPIVLLMRRPGAGNIAPAVAPGNPFLGCMLPYTPLHHLLLHEVGFPLVATSGNLSDEPICVENDEAFQRLGGIADAFLVHNRPIARQMDDSVVRLADGQPMMLRRARGYAPYSLPLDDAPPVLAVGAHLKNTVAISSGGEACVSQHIGDLETPAALDAFERTVEDLQQLYETRPRRMACDLHPGYFSTRYARRKGLEVSAVQHHHAHIASCMAEHGLTGTVLGVAWDGAGYGPDGTVWGGEFLLAERHRYVRTARFRTFQLPGGDRAAREPRRVALSILFELFGEDAFTLSHPVVQSFSQTELNLLAALLEKGVQSPRTSSAGRLFDAVSALLGLRLVSSYEGQAAMELEFAAHANPCEDHYPLQARHAPNGLEEVDWSPWMAAILEDQKKGHPAGLISTRFHNTLVEAVILQARKEKETRVALSGGCFQNLYLANRVARRLREEGFTPFLQRQAPPNDGGLCLGQMAAMEKELQDVSRDTGKN